MLICRRASLLSAGLLKALSLAREPPPAARQPSPAVRQPLLASGAAPLGAPEEEEEEGEEERRSVSRVNLGGVNHVTVSVRSPKALPANYTPLHTPVTSKAPASTLRLLHFPLAPTSFTFQLSAHHSTHPLGTAETPLGGACSPCTHSPRAQRVRRSSVSSHEQPHFIKLSMELEHVGPQDGGPRRSSIGDGLLMHLGVKQHNHNPNRLGLATPSRTRPPPPPRWGSVGDGLLMHMGVKQHNRDPIRLGLATPRRTVGPPPPPSPGIKRSKALLRLF